MHDSRMIAEVVPPGSCAMPKVSGSRMATPFAPPRPGSTPMMTPRITPANIRTIFFSDSAIANPCIRDWFAAISAKAEPVLDRPLGQGNLEPDFKDYEEENAVAYADCGKRQQRILAEPAHEEGDEQDRRNVDSNPADQADVDCAGHQDGQHHLELSHLDERLVHVARPGKHGDQIDRRRDTDDRADDEGKVPGLRAVVGPLRAQPQAVVHNDRARQQEERRDDKFGALLAKRGPAFLLALHASPFDEVISCRP